MGTGRTRWVGLEGVRPSTPSSLARTRATENPWQTATPPAVRATAYILSWRQESSEQVTEDGPMATTERFTELIPTPPDFPITFASAADARLFWQPDLARYPAPARPLEFAFIERGVEQGFNAALAAYGIPARVAVRRFNTYVYHAIEVGPRTMADGDELAAGIQRAEAALPGLGARWRSSFLPDIERHLAYWRGFVLRRAPLAALLAHLDETAMRAARLAEIRAAVSIPASLALAGFETACRARPEGCDATALLDGCDEPALAADAGLRRLVRHARVVPYVREALTWCAPHEALYVLERSQPGRDFLGALYSFLEQYGRAGDPPGLLAAPSRLEDPAPVFHTLREYLAQPDVDPAAASAALVGRREAQTLEIRRALRQGPRDVARAFEARLRAAREAAALRGELAHWLDGHATNAVRRVLLEGGRRLFIAGALDHPADVFYLTFEELRAIAAHPARFVLDGLIAARRNEVEHFRAITPAPAAGMRPAAPASGHCASWLGHDHTLGMIQALRFI